MKPKNKRRYSVYVEWAVDGIIKALPASVAVLRTDEQEFIDILKDHLSDFEDSIHDQYREW